MAANQRLFCLQLLLAVTQLCLSAHAETLTWKGVLAQSPTWYASPEAVRVADNVLLYQNPDGGWPKNIDMAQILTPTEQQRIRENPKRPVSLIDNGATYTQLRFLARIHTATGQALYRQSFLRGLDYLLAAQYENGGWPMVFPLKGGYYDHITFNDGSMIGVMRLLRDIARAEEPFCFVDQSRQARAAAAVKRGLEVILQTQVKIEGQKTVWCAQYDHQNLTAAGARAYELPSLSGAESVDIVRYLMEITPTPAVAEAIESAVNWFERVKLTGLRVIKKPAPELPGGYDLVVGFDPVGGRTLWARFYEIGTNYPIFAGRDGVARYALSEIEHERRVGYRWLGDWPRSLLEKDYPDWRKHTPSLRHGEETHTARQGTGHAGDETQAQ